MTPQRDLTARRALLRRAERGHGGRDGGLRERDARLVGREAGDPDVVVAFCGGGVGWGVSCVWGRGERGEREGGERTEMQLEVLHLERVPTSMLRKSAPKVGDGVDELVRNVEEQLQSTPPTELGSPKRLGLARYARPGWRWLMVIL